MIGIFLLFIAIQQTEAEKVSVVSITEDYIGKLVSVDGEVKNKFVSKNGHVFFDLEDGSSEIQVVIFDRNLRKMRLDVEKLKNGDKITVEGIIEFYKGELEIIPEKIII